MDSSPAIQIQDVSKSYGPVLAVSHLTLTVSPGDIFGFLGPNGAGKTTTIRLLTGFLRPTSGAIRVFGIDPWRDGVAIKPRVGFCPTSPPSTKALAARSCWNTWVGFRPQGLSAGAGKCVTAWS